MFINLFVYFFSFGSGIFMEICIILERIRLIDILKVEGSVDEEVYVKMLIDDVEVIKDILLEIIDIRYIVFIIY